MGIAGVYMVKPLHLESLTQQKRRTPYCWDMRLTGRLKDIG